MLHSSATWISHFSPIATGGGLFIRRPRDAQSCNVVASGCERRSTRGLICGANALAAGWRAAKGA